jgi:hypothetical protein
VPEFGAKVESIEKALLATEMPGTDLSSLLIAPIQRICKYPLLFRAILKSLKEDDPLRKQMGDVVESIESMTMRVNMESGRNAADLFQLSERIGQDLVDPSRRFISEHDVTLVHQKTTMKGGIVFLCSDILVFVRYKESLFSDSYKHYWTLKLDLVDIRTEVEDPFGFAVFDNSGEVKTTYLR